MDLAGEPAHTRDMTYRTFTAGEGRIIVQCRLNELRLKDYYKLTGDRVPAGPLHDMEVVLLIKTPSLVIEDVEVYMARAPREECMYMRNSLEPLKGISVTKGFTANVRRLCGGIRGGTHLVTLLTGAGPAIVQGYMAIASRRQPGRKAELSGKGSGMLAYLKNTCYVWREDGEACLKLEKLIGENSPGKEKS